MNCSKLDCIGYVNFGIMSQSLPLMGTTLVSNKKIMENISSNLGGRTKEPTFRNRK
jgi:hypothetical protein